jgi:hypothetical protein
LPLRINARKNPEAKTTVESIRSARQHLYSEPLMA